jgi:nitrogen permease regulator 2-like protein
VPPGSTSKPLIHFPSISSFIIPRQTFCDLPLTLLRYPYRILSHPICLTSPSYPRNEFIFSFSIVLHHRTPFSPYLSVVTKLAHLFQHLEETYHFLSNDVSLPDTGQIFALCEILLEDLNNYSEAMIPIDDANTLNIKLFPTYPPPPSISPHQVPLALVNLSALKDDNWDLTMLRILPFVDGVSSVRRIARKADADYKLVRKAIAHLVYYGCVMLIDVFSFGACYAPTEIIATFVVDGEMQREGRSYVLTAEARAAILSVSANSNETKGLGLVGNSVLGASLGSLRSTGAGGGGGPTISPTELAAKVSAYLDGSGLAELYLSLRQGQSLRNWCIEHADLVSSGVLDVRRFINFGIVKGLLYRVHKYAIASGRSTGNIRERGAPEGDNEEEVGGSGVGASSGSFGGTGSTGGGRQHAGSGSTLDGGGGGGGTGNMKSQKDIEDNLELAKYLDGLHCFDEICTELGIAEKDLLARLKNWGDVQIIYR